jgi:hypothetical protein
MVSFQQAQAQDQAIISCKGQSVLFTFGDHALLDYRIEQFAPDALELGVAIEDFEGLAIFEAREERHGEAAIALGEVIGDHKVQDSREGLDEPAEGFAGGSNLVEGDPWSESEEHYVVEGQVGDEG